MQNSTGCNERIYMMTTLKLNTARNKCPPPIQGPDKAEFKVGDMVLLKNHVPANAFNIKYKPSFRIYKQIYGKAFGVQGSARRVRHMFLQHFQLLLPAEHVFAHLPDITSFGWMIKYINHPSLMPNLHTLVDL